MMLQIFKKWLFILLKMSMIATSGLLAIIMLGTFFNMLSYRSKLLPPIMLPIPSAKSIGRGYLLAVIEKNVDHIAEDQECIYEMLLQNITQYGSAAVQNVDITTKSFSSNSDHYYELTSVKFEYRHSNKLPWQAGEIRLMTVTNMERKNSLLDALPFRRVFCGGSAF